MNAPFLKESKNALLIPAKMPAQNPDKEGVRVQGTGFRGQGSARPPAGAGHSGRRTAVAVRVILHFVMGPWSFDLLRFSYQVLPQPENRALLRFRLHVHRQRQVPPAGWKVAASDVIGVVFWVGTVPAVLWARDMEQGLAPGPARQRRGGGLFDR